ncbi:MAG: STAS domain protein [Candidatus Hydrogenedentes bacterium ADurb.Bin101]|nr:MAG: STAS domain protein [Candidatus Hydrogenedentes bacterium ADurb.Bin101]
MDFSGVNDIDGCAVQSFGALIDAYQDAGITFALAAVKGPVRDVLERSAWPALLGKRMEYASVQQALDAILE